MINLEIVEILDFAFNPPFYEFPLLEHFIFKSNMHNTRTLFKLTKTTISISWAVQKLLVF